MDMIERVARAVKNANVNGSKYDLTDHYAEAIARAAIEAMREPTEDMVESGAWKTGTAQYCEHLVPRALNEARDVFNTMIEHALNKQGGR